MGKMKKSIQTYRGKRSRHKTYRTI